VRNASACLLINFARFADFPNRYRSLNCIFSWFERIQVFRLFQDDEPGGNVEFWRDRLGAWWRVAVTASLVKCNILACVGKPALSRLADGSARLSRYN
jgi:hypothetical protein